MKLPLGALSPVCQSEWLTLEMSASLSLHIWKFDPDQLV